jgi:MFS family permease
VIGRSVPNIISDKAGRFNVMVIMNAFSTILILALWLPATGNAALIVFAVLFGIGSGTGIGLFPALVAQISPIHEIGIRTGTALSLASFATLSGSHIGGAIVGATGGNFKYATVFAGISFGVATVMFAAAQMQLAGLRMVKV